MGRAGAGSGGGDSGWCSGGGAHGSCRASLGSRWRGGSGSHAISRTGTLINNIRPRSLGAVS